MPFRHTLTVRFDEIDRAGIAYFAQVFRYCHVAYEELIAQAVGSLEDLFRSRTWATPMVHAEADYVRPMFVGDVLTIDLQVERLGEKSVTFAYEVRGEDGQPRARVRLIHAFVELEGFVARPVPEAFRAGLVRLGLVPG